MKYFFAVILLCNMALNILADENELSAIAEWGKIIYEKLNKYEDEREAADKEYNKRVAELYGQNNKKKQALNKEEENEYRELLNSPENGEIVNRLGETGTNDYTIRVNYSKKNNGSHGKTDSARESIEVIRNTDK